MKNIFIALFLLSSFSIFCSCNSSSKKSETVITIKKSDVLKERIGVKGMTCVGCEITLEENIAKIKGVVSVKASHSDNEAVIEFDSTKTNIEEIKKTIKKSGYKPFKNYK